MKETTKTFRYDNEGESSALLPILIHYPLNKYTNDYESDH